MNRQGNSGCHPDETKTKFAKFPERKKLNNGVVCAGVIDEDYSADEIIETSKKKNLESFEKISDSDSIDSARNEDSLDASTSTVMSASQGMTFLELRDLLDRRVADARFDVVENKIDRVIKSLKSDSHEEEKQVFQIMLARIRDLEQKLDQKKTKKVPVNMSLDPVIEKPVHPYSTYVVEKATQTPSKDHHCEGVYVLVSKKNNQKVRQVYRNFNYTLDDKMGVHPRGPYYYDDEKPTQPLVRKVVRKVGYPEYVYEETHENGDPTWNTTVRKTVAFLPPIPDPYAKRRPRNYHHNCHPK